ncbi:hypothetical protein GO988_15950 [Hymenobacter sp. HMF4947]|uniref:Uncharacterized protein n=1 Tax=Hymenobacter ginkgonis TaxID=2682976 RepID=A0A7K1THC4_9BACT|nr:hypothetical protein [Hymenobacter ginkgonis]MVN77825.1 hypothetical protein [Hymenobacter ginkgonis]
MPTLTIYTLAPPSYGARAFADYLATQLRSPVRLRPLSELPAPQGERRSSLRLERQELRQDLAVIGWHLEQYAQGRCLPDAGHQNGLLADRDALRSRLRAVERTLGVPAPE